MESGKPRLQNIVQGLTASGDDVMVLTADPKAPARFCGAEVVSLHASPPPPPHSPELLRLAALCACVVSRLAASRPHAIHVAGPGLAAAAATLYGRLRGVPVVDHSPDTGRLGLGGLLRLLWSVLAGAVALALWHLDYARHLRGQEQLMLAAAEA
ncbi:hypothetical protein HYH03_012599 [Edaphochlamys debaryana]|uniref:Glycosyltransferase subfamily 4-like N-terminal domain-containing protein n=1 Tax=Edaphochlamys debaryana TaxID=47281 RepID=A0A836BVA1_9CHLO|nr:hypothetical protein HYH03_012599 [Edaphochlamys debaryana]|eukprot:KAG2488799.1 hypothetical protein HYH03_012599 [Edaphochlamys debaryana]